MEKHTQLFLHIAAGLGLLGVDGVRELGIWSGGLGEPAGNVDQGGFEAHPNENKGKDSQQALKEAVEDDDGQEGIMGEPKTSATELHTGDDDENGAYT